MKKKVEEETKQKQLNRYVSTDAVDNLVSPDESLKIKRGTTVPSKGYCVRLRDTAVFIPFV